MGLQSEITDYSEHELRELHELERFFKSLSFHAGIEYAASGVTPHINIHPHQRRFIEPRPTRVRAPRRVWSGLRLARPRRNPRGPRAAL